MIWLTFWDESIKNKMAAAAIWKRIDMVVVGVIFFSLFLDIDKQSLQLRGPAINCGYFQDMYCKQTHSY